MSKEFDSKLPPQERERMLRVIRSYLPAFLRRDASVQPDPAGDVRELLNLRKSDLDRVIAVHECLDERIIAFGDALSWGIRRPMAANVPTLEARQDVRGRVDWVATFARRSLAAGDSSMFVVPGAKRAFDTPENRALVWLLDRLSASTRLALPELAKKSDEELEQGDASGWPGQIETLANQIQWARRAAWLRDVAPEFPTPGTLRRLRASRTGFYAQLVAPAARRALAFSSRSPEVLADVLSRRYFEPVKDWMIFEIYVALTLARAFEQVSSRSRKTRLLVGGGRAAFASYLYEDGSEVSLVYQAWPPKSGRSEREKIAQRHQLRAASKRPDLFVLRSEPEADAVVLELKASASPSYLADGLTQILGYLGEKPQIFKAAPSGWLVAPMSNAFSDRTPGPEGSLWIVSADQAAAAAVERFVPVAARATH